MRPAAWHAQPRQVPTNVVRTPVPPACRAKNIAALSAVCGFGRCPATPTPLTVLEATAPAIQPALAVAVIDTKTIDITTAVKAFTKFFHSARCILVHWKFSFLACVLSGHHWWCSLCSEGKAAAGCENFFRFDLFQPAGATPDCLPHPLLTPCPRAPACKRFESTTPGVDRTPRAIHDYPLECCAVGWGKGSLDAE